MAKAGQCSACDGTGLRPTHIMRTRQGLNVTEQRITAEQYDDLVLKVEGIGLQQVAPAMERCLECDYGRKLMEAVARDREELHTVGTRRATRLRVVGGR